MKRNLHKILVAVITVFCVLSVQLSASAIDFNIGNLDLEDLKDLIGQLTTANPDNTTTTEAETTTDAHNEEPSNPVNSSGTGVYGTTEAETTTVGGYQDNNYYPTYNNNNNNNNGNFGNLYTTTEPAGDESTTLSFEASLSDIFEDDSAAIIVQTPTETYTIGNLVVKNENEGNNEFTWQMGALMAAAVLLVVLIALIVALLIQNSKKKKKRRYYDSYPKNEESSAPVPVEVMTPERIAELLGSAAGRNVSNTYETMSSDETAAAIKAAALMGQLSNSYSDPLLRKYTDEPVMISQNGSPIPDADYASVADILKATDYIMDDIENADNVEEISETSGYTDEKTVATGRICPECGNDVPVDDIFCHECGTYIG